MYVVKQLDSVESNKMNWLNESLNECILIAGHGFYTKHNETRHMYIYRESDAATFSQSETV
jgi:hypothetical protein